MTVARGAASHLGRLFKMHPAVGGSRFVAGTLVLTIAICVVAWVWTLWRPDMAMQIGGYVHLHAFLEICSIIVCVLVFAVSRAAFGEQRNRNMMMIGAAFLGVALLDFLHMQSYQGMPALVTSSGPEKAINFWLAARLLTAAALVAAAFLSWERMAPSSQCSRWTAGVLAGVAAFSAVALFRPDWLPRTFVPGHGLTAFKVLVEYVVVALSLVAACGFYRLAVAGAPAQATGVSFDPAALMAATLVTAMAEICFTLYDDVSGLFNLLGHIYKVVGAWFLYRGLVDTNLRDTQTRNALALEAAGLGVWTWDVVSDAIEWDGRAASMWGLEASIRPRMRDIDSMIIPQDLAQEQEAIRQAFDPAGNGVYRNEYRIAPANGAPERRLASFGRTEFRDDRPIRVIGIVRDVTERGRAEDALRYSEARLSGILAIAAEAIITIDSRHCITMFNDGAEEAFGYASSEVIGQPLDMLIPARFRATHDGHINAFAASGTRARRMGERSEIFGLGKGGREFPAEASISMLDIGGQRMFTVVLRDITARKETERAMARAKEELEARIQQRTSELQAETERRLEAQAALARAQRMEAFGQLAGGIAHDFNNLLTVITGNQELLEMRLEDPKHLALLKRSQEAAEMGARLTGRLLTFARRRQLEPSLVNLNEQITGMVELLRRAIGENITLTTNLAPQLWSVLADASEIENAVLNLAINARDAMPNGGMLVIETADCAIDADEIGGERKLPAGDYVRISVSDTGAGMTSEVLGRAFEPFFTTKPPGKGTGLGLSTIYGFVEQSGGTVTVYSRPGSGTTVNIYLPRAAVAFAGVASGPAGETPVARGETILVVEDDPAVRDVTVKRLNGLGYVVLEAQDGPQAIERIKESGRDIRLVLSDVVMPGGMSGFDVASWVSSNCPGLRVLLTSGYPDQMIAAQASGQPLVRVLRKPYNRSELARALRDALDK